MIIGDFFDNDPIWIQKLQHDLYWGIVARPFFIAREKYLNAEKILGINTQLGEDCRAIDSIDHRVLQGFHDIIAARFRYDFVKEFNMYSLGSLFEDKTLVDEIKQKWLRFFEYRINFIFDDYFHLPKQVLIAVTYPNPDNRGKDAEDIIQYICENMYQIFE